MVLRGRGVSHVSTSPVCPPVTPPEVNSPAVPAKKRRFPCSKIEIHIVQVIRGQEYKIYS